MQKVHHQNRTVFLYSVILVHVQGASASPESSYQTLYGLTIYETNMYEMLLEFEKEVVRRLTLIPAFNIRVLKLVIFGIQIGVCNCRSHWNVTKTRTACDA